MQRGKEKGRGKLNKGKEKKRKERPNEEDASGKSRARIGVHLETGYHKEHN